MAAASEATPLKTGPYTTAPYTYHESERSGARSCAGCSGFCLVLLLVSIFGGLIIAIVAVEAVAPNFVPSPGAPPSAPPTAPPLVTMAPAAEGSAPAAGGQTPSTTVQNIGSLAEWEKAKAGVGDELLVADFTTVGDWCQGGMKPPCWCHQCKEMSRELKKIAVDYAAAAVFAEVETDPREPTEGYALAKELNVTGVPTVVFLRNGTVMSKAYDAEEVRTFLSKSTSAA